MTDFDSQMTTALSKVNVPVNWGRLYAGLWILEKMELSSTGLTLRDLICPWYMEGNTSVNRKSAPLAGDKLITVGEASADTFAHHWFNKPRMEGYAQAFASQSNAEATLVVFYVDNRRLLLLDGCHRSVAIVRTGVTHCVHLLVFKAPLDPTLCPDLAVFV